MYEDVLRGALQLHNWPIAIAAGSSLSLTILISVVVMLAVSYAMYASAPIVWSSGWDAFRCSVEFCELRRSEVLEPSFAQV
jgi:hypothetical protein